MLQYLSEARTIHVEAGNNAENVVYINRDESLCGEGKGMYPMELMLESVASCSAIDVVE